MYVIISTDPEAHYYTLKAFRSQNVSFRPQSVRKSSGVFIVIIKMANWEWRRIESSPIYFEIKFLISYLRTFLWNCFDLQDIFEI